MERLAHMECDREKLSKESHELREQNELLEFRIIELEESHDKVSSFFYPKSEIRFYTNNDIVGIFR